MSDPSGRDQPPTIRASAPQPPAAPSPRTTPTPGATGAAHTRYRAIPAPREPERRGPPIKAMVLLALLAVGAYGGYSGYCRYHVAEKVKALEEQADGLRQALLRVPRATREDIRAAVIRFAAAAGVEVDPASIVPSIEPLGPGNMHKLPGVAAAAMSMVVSSGLKTQHTWLVGFRATFFAKHGVAKRVFVHERHTYLEDAQP